MYEQYKFYYTAPYNLAPYNWYSLQLILQCTTEAGKLEVLSLTWLHKRDIIKYWASCSRCFSIKSLRENIPLFKKKKKKVNNITAC